MMKNLLVLLMVTSTVVIAGPPGKKPLHVDTYKVDTQNSKVEWFATKVTGTHNGTINLASGELHNNHGRFAGKFTMDMNSIAVTDLTGSGKTKLENHLKSEDFFATATHNSSTLEIVSLTPLTGVEAGKPNFTVNGKLTIKGITQDISFPALIRFNGPAMTASGEMLIDRTKFDIKYRSKVFFADIGDKAIADEFTLKFDIKANL